MYKNILFDLDGTLTDPAIGITNSVAYALGKLGIEVHDKRELLKFIGPPLQDSFMKYYGMSEEEALDAVEKYREYFRDKGIYENEVYPGVRELLAALKKAGRRVILATSKPEEFAEIILKYFGLREYFDFVAGATMDGSRRKKADVIAYAMAKCEINEPGNTVMIGDKEQDVIGATRNGLASIGVLYGYGSKEELMNVDADYIVESAEDIMILL